MLVWCARLQHFDKSLRAGVCFVSLVFTSHFHPVYFIYNLKPSSASLIQFIWSWINYVLQSLIASVSWQILLCASTGLRKGLLAGCEMCGTKHIAYAHGITRLIWCLFIDMGSLIHQTMHYLSIKLGTMSIENWIFHSYTQSPTTHD